MKPLSIERFDQISNCLSQHVVPDWIHRRDGLGRPTYASDMYFTLHNTVSNPYHTCWQLDDHWTAVGLGYGEIGCGVLHSCNQIAQKKFMVSLKSLHKVYLKMQLYTANPFPLMTTGISLCSNSHREFPVMNTGSLKWEQAGNSAICSLIESALVKKLWN